MYQWNDQLDNDHLHSIDNSQIYVYVCLLSNNLPTNVSVKWRVRCMAAQGFHPLFLHPNNSIAGSQDPLIQEGLLRRESKCRASLNELFSLPKTGRRRGQSAAISTFFNSQGLLSP